jgi:hypothetical protein
MDAPDTDFSGYPANLKAGYRISSAGRIPDIRRRPVTGYPAGFLTPHANV